MSGQISGLSGEKLEWSNTTIVETGSKVFIKK